MKFDVLDFSKKRVSEIEVSDDVFLAEPCEGLVHQLLLLQHTRPFRNANTKTRAEVRGGGRKPWRQKGTGKARAGSIRSPLFAGGGVALGPRFHEISFDMPKRARKKALCAALSMKKDDLLVLQDLSKFSNAKTSEAVSLIEKLEIADKKLLILVDQHSDSYTAICRAFANIERCRVIHWQNLNVHDLFNAERVLLDASSFKNIETWLLTYKSRKGVKVS